MYSVMPNSICNNVIIIGCGGTGSRLINLISQFLNSLDFLAKAGLNVYLVDDDVVEEKNLRRQNFTKNDIGKHKAQVMAQRYSKAYEVNMEAIVERIEYSTYKKADSKFAAVLSKLSATLQTPLVIMCVDSPMARRAIMYNLIISRVPQALVIDTGNEDTFGQVKVMNLNRMAFTTSRAVSLSEKHIKIEMDPKAIQVPEVIGLPFIPLDLEYFASMTAQTAASCADLDQTMAINNLMAAWAFAYVQDWCFARPIKSHQMVIELATGAQPQYLNTRYIKNADQGFWNAVKTINAEAKENGDTNESLGDYIHTVSAEPALLEVDAAYEKMQSQIRAAQAEAEAKAKADQEILDKAKREAEAKTTKAEIPAPVEKAEKRKKKELVEGAVPKATKRKKKEVVPVEVETPAEAASELIVESTDPAVIAA